MSFVLDFVREAGWPIYPVMGLGALTFFSAVRLFEKPTEQLAAVCRGLCVLTVVMAAIGTLLGVQVTIRAVEQVGPEMRWIFLVGLRESLNNLLAGLVLLIPSLALYVAARVRQR